MNITLKNVPEPVYLGLRQAAAEEGRSLNSQIIRTLEAEVTEQKHRRRLKKALKELNRFASSLPALDDSTPLIRRDRQR